MRYQHIIEKIDSTPINYNLWLTNRISNLENIKTAIEKLSDTIDKNYDAGYYLLRYALGQVLGERPQISDKWWHWIDNNYQVSNIIQNLENIKKWGSNFEKYLTDNLKYIKFLPENDRVIFEACKKADIGFADYGYDKNDPSGLDDEYYSAASMAQAFSQMLLQIDKLEKEINWIIGVSSDRELRYQHQFTPHTYVPKHEDIETLYHASFYAADIAKKGFEKTKPSERKGLGSLGGEQSDVVSFTHNFAVVNDVWRTFRELWQIVHGEISRRDILNWISSENIDKDFAQKTFYNSKLPPTDPVNVVGLYRAYLALSKIRRDPMFFNHNELVPELQKIPLSSIGILECSVDLSHKDYDYNNSEKEFKVPPSRILTIKRIR